MTYTTYRCRLFGHKYPWDAHETKQEENKAAQYSCARRSCDVIVTRNPEKALFTPSDYGGSDE